MQICLANLTSDLDGVKKIFNDFALSSDIISRYQFLEEETDMLHKIYALPKGAVLLAKDQENIIGCVAFKAVGEKICELNRLYIKPEYRGRKLGRLLLSQLMDFARLTGYKTLKAQTQTGLQAALNLYKSLGFVIISPSHVNQFKEVVYMEKKL